MTAEAKLRLLLNSLPACSWVVGDTPCFKVATRLYDGCVEAFDPAAFYCDEHGESLDDLPWAEAVREIEAGR